MLWTAGLQNGYACFSIAGRSVRANRVSLWIAVGPPPAGDIEAAHECRNKHCVAPSHLRWATPLENQHDRLRDGTHNRGENNSQARLSKGQVIEMRRLYDSGITNQCELARRFGINSTTARRIVLRKTWIGAES